MIEVLPSGPLSGQITVPGSKYQANRALIMAGLAAAPSRISSVPDNDDIYRVRQGLLALGAAITEGEQGLDIQPLAASSQWPSVQLYAGASGTFARFALALAALGHQPITVDGTTRLRERPMRDLATALRQLGVKVEGDNDALPLTLTGPLRGGVCELPGHVSSQFVSALLLASVKAQDDVRIVLSSELVSRNYVDMTCAMMARQGVVVEREGNSFIVRAGQHYHGGSISLEADPCSASYFMAAAALTGGDIHIAGFSKHSVQGEAQFPYVLQKMGCHIDFSNDGLRVLGPEKLSAVDVDMGDMPDVVQTLAVLAAFANGVTRIRNIGHLVHKESNRIFDTALELKKMGVDVRADADSLVIVGGFPHGSLVQTHHDHRMGMSFAIAGLKIGGVKLDDAQVVDKSFPQYWQTLRQLGVQFIESKA